MCPLFEQGRIWLPQTCYKTNYEKKTEDLVTVFIEEEFKPFPVMRHDDMMDNIARLEDEAFKPLLKWPIETKPASINLPPLPTGPKGAFAR